MLGLIELIDTQWNVNLASFDVDEYNNAGINRYIVECKFNR